MDKSGQVTYEVKKEREKTKNAVALLVILGIGLLVVIGLVLMLQAKLEKNYAALSNNTNMNKNESTQNLQDNKENVKVDFNELVKELYNKEYIYLLPELTDEERTDYERDWNEDLGKMIGENEKLIKKKYPELSDNDIRKYAIQFTEYIKEDMFRITKANRELKDNAENAVDDSNFANARAALTLKYAEVMSAHYAKDAAQEYKVNESDLKILQQYVLEKSDGKYTVKIAEDNKGYEVEKAAN